ncbi:Glu/Leu/Phe/Val dehydrogenase dimerization domain-containing protein [Streptacidiphilus monticola]
MKAQLAEFEAKAPQIVFEWHDTETPAKGWVVINSLRGGAAGGGTRMRAGLDRHEVESLAKTMEIKFTVSGPAIGGAKSGIDFDPRDPRKEGVLTRWYQAITLLLRSYYGTGGDLNVDEMAEVVPLTEALGLWHPQEGVVQGHYGPGDRELVRRVGQLRQGVAKVVEDPRFSPTRPAAGRSPT